MRKSKSSEMVKDMEAEGVAKVNNMVERFLSDSCYEDVVDSFAAFKI